MLSRRMGGALLAVMLLLAGTIVASIGPVTAEAAARCNIHSAIVPAQSTIPALVDAIVKHFEPPATSHQPPR